MSLDLTFSFTSAVHVQLWLMLALILFSLKKKSEQPLKLHMDGGSETESATGCCNIVQSVVKMIDIF
jgi:hypothetical protein